VVKRHPVADPPAAIMTGDREALMAQCSHRLHLGGVLLPVSIAARRKVIVRTFRGLAHLLRFGGWR
jgi:hypothetical protein